ncbi:kinase-like domain-containing protein [Penicillium sp. IBT 31633x]|nr:kinase-like domain-containing protein [Penicillium sp. IBT 31633x]
MSYEAGEPLEHYWNRVSEAEQDRILEQLRDYVTQMREIPGDFIGGVDSSPCRDGIFETGYGDYTRYSYGPYQSEESFDEGIIQALRDRLPPKVLKREDDIESNFFNSEYMLYQTVRGLKNHKIVFTHGDLHPGNIIVRSDGTAVLLDWGLAGFWPENWEFYRAMNSPRWRASWDHMVKKFVPPFYVEYSIMK